MVHINQTCRIKTQNKEDVLPLAVVSNFVSLLERSRLREPKEMDMFDCVFPMFSLV